MSFSPRRLLLLLPLLLAACESMSPAECATADWRQRGERDGAAGRGDRSAAYHESCAKVGITPDVAAYRAARESGLQQYCRLDVALSEGLAGKTYGGVCPGPIDLHFRIFNEAAYSRYQAQKNLTQLQRDQDNMQSQLRSDKTSDERKRSLREELSRSDRRLNDARNDLRTAESRLDRLSRELRQNGLY